MVELQVLERRTEMAQMTDSRGEEENVITCLWRPE